MIRHDFARNGTISADPHSRPQPNYSYREWLAHLKKLGARCYWCLIPLTEVTARKDHLTPVSRFGTDELANIVPSCGRCNSLKGNKNEAEFRAWKSGRGGNKGMGETGKTRCVHKEMHRLDFFGTVRDYLRAYDQELLEALEMERKDVTWWKG